jgi:hypothetical protein
MTHILGDAVDAAHARLAASGLVPEGNVHRARVAAVTPEEMPAIVVYPMRATRTRIGGGEPVYRASAVVGVACWVAEPEELSSQASADDGQRVVMAALELAQQTVDELLGDPSYVSLWEYVGQVDDSVGATVDTERPLGRVDVQITVQLTESYPPRMEAPHVTPLEGVDAVVEVGSAELPASWELEQEAAP